MSNHHKLSLWQKLKRLLTSRAPQDIINPNDTHSANHDNAPDLPAAATTTEQTNKDNTDDSYSERKNTAKSVKLSLIKQGANSGSEMAIIDYLKLYCRHKHWHYTHYKPRLSDPQQSHHLSLRLKNRRVDCGYLFRVQEKEGLLAVYGILPFLIPESHQSAAMLLITQINYDLIVGNLEMDINDGEIRYKNAIDVEVVGLNDDIVEHLLQSVIAMTTVAYEVFGDLINTQDPSEDMPTLLGELRAQADARTFFLPTKKMQ